MRNRRGVARRGVGFSLFIVVAMSITLGLFLEKQGPHTAHAAEKKWQASNGAITISNIKTGRFVFLDPFTVKDTGTGTTYVSSAKQSDIFFNSTGSLFKGNVTWWFWPKGKDINSDKLPKDGNNCVGALFVETYKVTQDIPLPDFGSYNSYVKARFGLATPEKAPSGDCVIYSAGNHGDVDGVGAGADNGVTLDWDKFGSSDAAKLATLLYWQPGKHGDEIGVWGTSAKLKRITGGDRDVIVKLTETNTKDAGRFSYYTSTKCAGDHDQPEAWVAVDLNLNGGSNRDLARVFHRKGSDVNYEWDGAQLKCLFGREIQQGFRINIGGSSKTAGVGLAYPENATSQKDGGGETATPVGGGVDPDGGGGSKNYQCVVTPPLSWIACPVITLVVNALDVLEGAIIQSVQVPPLTTGGAFEGLHTTWAGFRDLANALLVVIFLITIFAQVLPFDIDPYMVKKTLPKLIAAAICIQFSYFFVQVMFDISRVLAQGVTSIIESLPVASIGGGLFGQNAGNATATSTLGLLGAVAAGTAAGAAAITAGAALAVPILLLLFAGLLSVVTLFVTLQMRMIIIIIMTMIAPLAFLAWVLPNTENYFKKWLVGLMKLLLMYPIIVFMVQSVNLISNISYEALNAMSGVQKGVVGGVGDISVLMVSIIPIVVYFMIPMTFKWAGGIFASVSGAIQNQGSRLSKRSMSAAGKSLGEARHKAGERLKDTGALKPGEWKSPGKAFRRLGARTASGNIFSFGEVGKRKIKASEQQAYSAIAEATQDTLRGKNNRKLLEEDFQEAYNKGEMTRATAIADLILQQGGDLEMEGYFRKLEWKDGKVGTTKTGKVTRNPENGAVEQVDDPIWQQLTKLHGASLAAKLPHTVGKPIIQASPDQIINGKGQHSAWELEQEIKQQRAIYDANSMHDANSSDPTIAARGKLALDAKAKLVRVANNFYTASQKENASEMGDDMVRTWQHVASKINDLGLEFGGVGAKEFIDRQTAGGSLKRYVQGTQVAGGPTTPPSTPADPAGGDFT